MAIPLSRGCAGADGAACCGTEILQPHLAGGEGGLLIVNDEQYISRAEIIWEKGTNRAEFFRGMVNKYGWVDIESWIDYKLNDPMINEALTLAENIELYKVGI